MSDNGKPWVILHGPGCSGVSLKTIVVYGPYANKQRAEQMLSVFKQNDDSLCVVQIETPNIEDLDLDD